MPNRRYHIHLACVSNDQPDVLDNLALFFEHRAFLTRDLRVMNNSDTMNYSRRCIDSCDYVIVIIGDEYGELNPSGVSQLHLSYINAKTKNKPMLILIKSHDDTQDLSRQLIDLIRMIEQQKAGFIYYYDNKTNLSLLLENAFAEMLRHYKGLGWVRATPKEAQAPSYRSAEVQHHSNQNMLNKPSKVDQNSLIQNVHLNNSLTLHYYAHAYSAGNLAEVSLQADTTWREILKILLKLPSQFSTQGLLRALNDLVSLNAMETVKQTMPNVHAVSRCQVTQADLMWIQEELISLGWIESINSHTRSSRELWTVTQHAKQINL